MRLNYVLTLVVMNVLLNTWAAVAQSANPIIHSDPTSKLASAAVTSDRATGDNSTYLFTMTLPERTGKHFTKLSVSLTEQNSDKTIAPMQFDLPSTKAFAGESTARGQAIGIQNAWIDETGVLWIQFKAPVPPQTKLTLALKLRQLPAAATYHYGIAAYPTKAAAIFVGDGTLMIKH